MGRPKKNDSGLLVHIAVEFYENEANGDLSKMKFTKLSEYAQKRGYDIGEQHFRRDRQVQVKLDELREVDEDGKNRKFLAAYKSLDVNEVFAQSKSLGELKRNIAGLDGYWREVYLQSVRLEAENKSLKVKPSFEKEMRELEGRNLVLADSLSRKDRENRMLEQEVSYLKGMLKKYLYPAIAEEILQEERLVKAKKSSVKPEMLGQLIEGKWPATFDGMPHAKPEKPDRMEKLLQGLEGMVDET